MSGLRALGPLVLTAAVMVCALQCTTVPDLGRSQLMSVSAGEETRLGLEAFAQYKKKARVSRDRALAERVRRIGQRLAAVASVPGAQWEFVLFEDSEPNAFAVPGGKVGVNTGIMQIARDEGGLATIIGHEIAHLAARHAGERLSQRRVAELGAGLLSAAFPEAESLRTGAGVAAQLGLLRFSRQHELEADRLGALLMARAGYDPRAAVGFWERFAAYKQSRQGGGNLEFLSTHPLDERRIAALQAFLPQAVGEYQWSAR